MKRWLSIALLVGLSSVCFGQLTTAAPHTGNAIPVRLTNTIRGQWSNPWTPMWVANMTSNPVTISNILLPPNVAISSPHGQNNCTNTGPLTISSGGACLLYVSYFASRTGHIALGTIRVLGPSGVPLDVLVTGYGCPNTWTNFQCGTFNAGW